MCKETLESIVVTTDSVRTFQELDLEAMIYDSNLRIYFDKKVPNVKELRDLSRRRCPICLDSSFDTNADLMNHVKETHGKVFCVTCLRERKVFPHEQRLYTETDLRRHIAEGDPPIGDEGAIKPHKKARAAQAILARTRSGEYEGSREDDSSPLPLPLPILRRSQTTSTSSLHRIVPLVRTRSHGRASPPTFQSFRRIRTPPSSPGRRTPSSSPGRRTPPSSSRRTSPRSASNRRKFELQKPRKLTRSISAPSRNSSHKLFKTSPHILRALTAARRSRRKHHDSTAQYSGVGD